MTEEFKELNFNSKLSVFKEKMKADDEFLLYANIFNETQTITQLNQIKKLLFHDIYDKIPYDENVKDLFITYYGYQHLFLIYKKPTLQTPFMKNFITKFKESIPNHESYLHDIFKMYNDQIKDPKVVDFFKRNVYPDLKAVFLEPDFIEHTNELMAESETILAEITRLSEELTRVTTPDETAKIQEDITRLKDRLDKTTAELAVLSKKMEERLTRKGGKKTRRLK
jgi:hypothetical protein